MASWKVLFTFWACLAVFGVHGANREVEEVEVDPGLLETSPSRSNATGTGRVNGKQFSNIPGQNFNPGQNFIPGQNFVPGQNGLLPGQNNFTPGANFIPGQSGTFLPGQTFGTGVGGFGVNGQFPPGQTGSFPGSQVPLPPGSVLQDTVAFSAVRASDFTRNAVTQVRFDSTVTDIGYGWYPDRSEFVCFYPGIYYFSFSALSPQTRQFKLTLVKNSQEIASAWGDANGYNTGSNSAVLQLQQNDRVYLVLQEGSLHESNSYGRGYTTFSGFRIR